MFSRNHNFRVGLRLTAALLLLVIAWGSTIEATHGHAGADRNLNAPQAFNCVEPPTEAAQRTSVQEYAPARSTSRPTASSECLICQLHHNLATTLLTEPASFDALHAQAARSLAPAPVHLLEFAVAQPGRAPPVNL